ncbi:Hypothetical predicted protein [Paramuricea clavata]|uniref:Uncharacterized protein n=1 Tax=Paramuricea clavata TaxID=317549 RepID=A0A6S7G0J2_PARCT|nr:Hypothetical predicted protein [Paramuricea clavata]
MCLDQGHPGIHLSKSVSFVSIRSRAYISCLHGNTWLVDGTKFKNGIRISFSGLTFLNTSLRFFDAFVAVNDTVFAETKLVSLDIEVFNLPRLDLSLKNVVFQQNTACMTIKPSIKSSKIFVNITNTLFYLFYLFYGNFSSNTPSILWLNSKENLINIQLRNCSFKKNTFKKYGLIVVVNKLGTTNFLLNQFRLEENSHTNPSIEEYDGLFRLLSAWAFMRLEYGLVYKTSSTFLTVTGNSSQINISNIQVDGFYSVTPGGGVVDVIQSDSCYLSIKDSSFRNGNNYGTGDGVLSIVVPNSMLTIQNSTIQNISNFAGATVLIQSLRSAYLQSTKHSKKFFVHLRIINSSFSYTEGGVVGVFAENLLATVGDSSFLRKAATYCGALCITTNDACTIDLHNVYFLENSADDGTIIQAIAPKESATFNLSMTNVIFVHNKIHACSQDLSGSIVLLWVRSTKSNVGFKNTRFMGNVAKFGGIVFLAFSQFTLSFVTLDTCIFRENIGYGGTVYIQGHVALTCKHSILDSNSFLPCQAGVMTLKLINSTIFFKNTTFVNNLCAALAVSFRGTTSLRIYDSAFVRDKYIGGYSAALVIDFQHFNQTNSHSGILRAFITRVLFQENIAATGSVLFVTSGEVTLTNCTFLNNFASFQGGQIVSAGRGSVDLAVVHSVFKQTIQKIIITNKQEFMITSFLRLYNSGTLFVYNTTFNWDTNSEEPLILVPKADRVSFDNASMSNCPVGHAIEKVSYSYFVNNNRHGTSLTLSCKACDYNFYSLQRGTARGLHVDDNFECMRCLRGAYCVPAIRAKSNFWGYQTSSNPPKLAFTICPFGYCKSPPANSGKYNDCQGKRTGVMCGVCSQGYTEALWSTYCTPVKDCHDHWFWVLFLALVFSMAILLVFKPPFVTYSLKQMFWFKRFAGSRTANIQANHDIIRSFSVDEETEQENIPLSSTEQLKQDKRQFSRFVEIIFYFYQIAQLLLSSSCLTEFFDTQFLVPVLGFFNFQPNFKKQGFLCPFPGLTPETKFGFKIAPVFGTLVAIFLIYALHFFISRMRGSLRPAVSPYLQASIKTIFRGYVTLATVSISLIRCVFVAGEARRFYNGNVLCYQWWQYASFTFNAIFMIPFIFVLAWISFKLHHDKITIQQFLLAIICPIPFLLLWMFRLVCPTPVVNVEENQNLNALKEMLLAPYRQAKGASERGALYWQSVLIARRFILVLIFCVVAEPSIRLFCMTLTCVSVLCCHLKVKPFQNSLANNLESLSLFFLVILGLVNLFKSVFVGSEQNIKRSLVAVVKVFQWLEMVMLGLFPAILLLLVCFAIISVFVRVLFMCFRSIFKCLFRPCAQRWFSRDSTRLLHVCDNNDDE